MFEHLESKFVDVGGIRTHYIEQGEGDDVIVLIHGGGSGADCKGNYATNFPIYAKKARTIAFDMVGFGGTDKPSPDEYAYTQDNRCQHVVDFLEALGLKDVNLIGNSMGGGAACGATLLRPDLIKNLVLMGAAINADHQVMVESQETNEVMKYDGTREGMRRVIKCLTYDYEPDEGLIDYRESMIKQSGATEAFRATMKEAFQNGLYFSPEQLGSLKPPVLLVSGRNDIMVTEKLMLKAMNDIPDASAYFISHCGHWVMIEYPELFCEVTLRFFGLTD